MQRATFSRSVVDLVAVLDVNASSATSQLPDHIAVNQRVVRIVHIDARVNKEINGVAFDQALRAVREMMHVDAILANAAMSLTMPTVLDFRVTHTEDARIRRNSMQTSRFFIPVKLRVRRKVVVVSCDQYIALKIDHFGRGLEDISSSVRFPPLMSFVNGGSTTITC